MGRTMIDRWSLCPRGLLAVVLALAIGCDSTEDDDDSADEGDSCEEGTVDDGGTCVPEACGTGRWGHLEVDGSTVFVDADADGDGDASEESPYSTIDEALDDATGDLVAIAAGSYTENLELTSDHDGIRLAGRCQEMVELDASGGEETAGIVVGGGGMARPAVDISGLTIRGATQIGIMIDRGVVTVHDVTLTENDVLGVVVIGGGNEAVLDRVTIRDTRTDAQGNWGYGLDVGSSSSATATDCLLDANSTLGINIYGSGAEVVLENVTVSNTQPKDNGDYGYGVQVMDWGTLIATNCTFEGNTDRGVRALDAGSRVELYGGVIRGTLQSAATGYGLGIHADQQATVIAEGTLVEGNCWGGIILEDSGTSAELDGVEVRDTIATGEVETGIGIRASLGASLTATDCVVDGNSSVGILIGHEGTTAQLTRVEIANTRYHAVIHSGYGFHVSQGAVATVQDCWFHHNGYVTVAAGNEGTELTLVDTVIEDTRPGDEGHFGYGVNVWDQASMVMQGGVIQRNQVVNLMLGEDGTSVTLTGVDILDALKDAGGTGGRGISMEEGARLVAEDCLIEGSEEMGLILFGQDTVAELTDVTIRDTGRSVLYTVGAGLAAQHNADVQANNMQIENSDGPGILLMLASLTCTGCRVTGSTFASLMMQSGDALLADTELGAVGTDANQGGGRGIYADNMFGAPTLTVRDSTVHSSPLAAVWLEGQGSYTFENNDLEGGTALEPYPGVLLHGDGIFALDGIQAWDGEEGLYVGGNTLHGADGTAVFLDGSRATLVDNTYSNNGTDVVQQACGELEPPEGYEEAPLAEICPVYDHVIQPLTFQLVLDETPSAE